MLGGLTMALQNILKSDYYNKTCLELSTYVASGMASPRSSNLLKLGCCAPDSLHHSQSSLLPGSFSCWRPFSCWRTRPCYVVWLHAGSVAVCLHCGC
jgi:hypothetical protein